MSMLARSALCALLVACGTRQTSAPQASAASGSQPDAGAADNPFGDFDFLGSLLSQQLDEPGPYDEPRNSDDLNDDYPYWAVIELPARVVELESMSLFGDSGTELRALLDELAALGADENVTGVLVRARDMTLSMAAAEELRAALLELRKKGEGKLACHADAVSTITYYVLGACQTLALPPGGSVAISGPAAVPIHVRRLLDMVGVAPDFIHMGAFKGAAEPLMRESPSPEMRQTLDAILDQAYATVVAGIAEGRKLPADAVKTLIDTAVFLDAEAVEAGLADAIELYEPFRDRVVAGSEWTVVEVGKSEGPDLGQLMRFLGLAPHVRPWQSHVALVYAVGPVVDGTGEGTIGARQEIAARPLSAALRVLGADDRVKAIVLRIDSPGGSALASEIIWHAVSEVRKAKPVIVSMAGVAGSGGYYIAAPATRILALENTLTGSIGVVGGKLAVRGGLSKLGVTAHPMGRGKLALMDSTVDRFTADERAAVERVMQGVYRMFVRRVAEGRGTSEDEVRKVAEGRLWTGAAAARHGLVDEIGGLRAALAQARKLGGVDEDAPLEVYPPEPTLIDFIESLGEVRAATGGIAGGLALGDAVRAVAHELGPREGEAVAALLDLAVMVRRTPVLTAVFVPAVVR